MAAMAAHSRLLRKASWAALGDPFCHASCSAAQQPAILVMMALGSAALLRPLHRLTDRWPGALLLLCQLIQ